MKGSVRGQFEVIFDPFHRGGGEAEKIEAVILFRIFQGRKRFDDSTFR